MPKQINTPSPGQKLVRAFGLKGRFQPLLDEVIVPVTFVDEEIDRRWASGSAYCTAAAGEYGIATLNNPAGSGIVIRAEQFITFSDLYDAWHLVRDWVWTAGTGPTASPNKQFMEYQPNPPVAVLNYGSSTYLNVTGLHFASTGASVTQYVSVPTILLPGESIALCSASVNLGTTLGFVWTEEDQNVTDRP